MAKCENAFFLRGQQNDNLAEVVSPCESGGEGEMSSVASAVAPKVDRVATLRDCVASSTRFLMCAPVRSTDGLISSTRKPNSSAAAYTVAANGVDQAYLASIDDAEKCSYLSCPRLSVLV